MASKKGNKRDVWGDRETETLVDHYILKNVRNIVYCAVISFANNIKYCILTLGYSKWSE